MQKIALIGATGMIGSRILMELFERSYVVTAISRHPEELPGSTLLIACEGDALNDKVVAGHVGALENEVIISAVNPDPNNTESFLDLTESLIRIAEKSGVKKLITVGGAGSLYLPDGSMLMDSADFPEAYKATADVHKRALDIFRRLEGKKFTWINVSPQSVIVPDEKTGKYQILTDEKVVFNHKGESFISAEDFASAVADLIESGTIENQRVTAAYL